jgi:hypothetical protein
MSIHIPVTSNLLSDEKLKLLPRLKSLKQLSRIHISGSLLDDIYRSGDQISRDDMHRELPAVRVSLQFH